MAVALVLPESLGRARTAGLGGSNAYLRILVSIAERWIWEIVQSGIRQDRKGRQKICASFFNRYEQLR